MKNLNDIKEAIKEINSCSGSVYYDRLSSRDDYAGTIDGIGDSIDEIKEVLSDIVDAIEELSKKA